MGLPCPGEVILLGRPSSSVPFPSPPQSLRLGCLILLVFSVPVQRFLSTLESVRVSFYPSAHLSGCAEQSFKNALWAVLLFQDCCMQEYRSKGYRYKSYTLFLLLMQVAEELKFPPPPWINAFPPHTPVTQVWRWTERSVDCEDSYK